MLRIFIFLSIICFNSLTLKAQSYKVGDRVMADITMATSPEYQRWKKAIIVTIQQWNGKVSGYSIKTDEGAEYVTTVRFLRKIPEGNNLQKHKEKKSQPDSIIR